MLCTTAVVAVAVVVAVVVTVIVCRCLSVSTYLLDVQRSWKCLFYILANPPHLSPRWLRENRRNLYAAVEVSDDDDDDVFRCLALPFCVDFFSRSFVSRLWYGVVPCDAHVRRSTQNFSC